MKAVGDLLIVILMAIIVWGITALVLIILSVNILVPNAAAVTSMAVATVTAIAFVAFCIKGRSVSKKESRTDSPKMISDFTVFRDYCATLAELDTTDYIYDQSFLPHPKERILCAAIRILEREDSPDEMRTGAALTIELSQFQAGVGPTPQPTLMSVISNSRFLSEDRSEIKQAARTIIGHTKSETELNAEKEREKLLSLVGDALR